MSYASRRLLPCLLALLATCLASRAGDLGTDSPFMAEAPKGGPAGPVRADYELTGISRIDDCSMACLFDKANKKSVWLTQGKKFNGLELLSIDTNTNQAWVIVNGERVTFSLRKPVTKGVAIASTAPEIGPAGGKLPPVVAVNTKEEQEREARMLVSDLLEIGQRQRKAYEDAVKKAAAEGKPVPPAPGSAPAQTPASGQATAQGNNQGNGNPPPAPPQGQPPSQ